MHFSTILLLAAGVTAHTGWTIPPGLIDGIYSVTIVDNNDTSTALHTLLATHDQTLMTVNTNSNTNTTSPRSPTALQHLIPSAKFSRALTPRNPANTGPNNVQCPGYTLPKADFDKVYLSLQTQCGNGALVNYGADVYSITNDVVAYYCNFMGSFFKHVKNNCYADEAVDARALIATACGWYNAGWDTVPDRGGSYGFERLSMDKKWCGRGTSG
ncbi:MAG: hypothetical protein MMC33_005129 [Icmadophila ericetorum]|nr:hypothetical protein [Icmadophila ericetorum]